MLVRTEVPLFSLASTSRAPPRTELGRRLVDGKNEDACHFHTITLALKGKFFSPVHILSLTLPSQDIWLLTLQSV